MSFSLHCSFFCLLKQTFSGKINHVTIIIQNCKSAKINNFDKSKKSQKVNLEVNWKMDDTSLVSSLSNGFQTQTEEIHKLDRKSDPLFRSVSAHFLHSDSEFKTWSSFEKGILKKCVRFFDKLTCYYLRRRNLRSNYWRPRLLLIDFLNFWSQKNQPWHRDKQCYPTRS